jgi:hypothetical protein
VQKVIDPTLVELVVPPVTSGLHCGWTNLGNGQPETLVAPPSTGGAPLRHDQ